jgi:hypothetical protein
MLATPSDVLMSAGHSEHNVTVIAELTNDFCSNGSLLTYTALTTIVTIGSHASGETGLKICTSGLIAYGLGQAREHAKRHGHERAEQEAREHRGKTREDLIEIGGLPVPAHRPALPEPALRASAQNRHDFLFRDGHEILRSARSAGPGTPPISMRAAF